MLPGNGPHGQGHPHEQAKFTLEKHRDQHRHELEHNRYQKSSWLTLFILIGVVAIFFGLMVWFTRS